MVRNVLKFIYISIILFIFTFSFVNINNKTIKGADEYESTPELDINPVGTNYEYSAGKLTLNGVMWDSTFTIPADYDGFCEIEINGVNKIAGVIDSPRDVKLTGSGAIIFESQSSFNIEHSFEVYGPDVYITYTGADYAVYLRGISSSLTVSDGTFSVTSSYGTPLSDDTFSENLYYFTGGYVYLSGSDFACIPNIQMIVNGAVVEMEATIAMSDANMLSVSSGVVILRGTEIYAEDGDVLMDNGISMYSSYVDGTVSKLTEGLTGYYDEGTTCAIFAKEAYDSYTLTSNSVDSVYVEGSVTFNSDANVVSSYFGEVEYNGYNPTFSNVVIGQELYKESGNDNPPESQITAIDKPVVSVTSFEYDGLPHSLDIPDNPGYTVTGNSITNASISTVTVRLNDGYIWSDNTTNQITFDLEVTPYLVTIPRPTKYIFTNDGTYHTLDIPTSEYYTVTGNGASQEGEYDVAIKLKSEGNFLWADSNGGELHYIMKIVPGHYIEYRFDEVSGLYISNPNSEIFSEVDPVTFMPLEGSGIHFIGWYLDEAHTMPITNTDGYDEDIKVYGAYELSDFEVVIDYNGLTYLNNQTIVLGIYSFDYPDEIDLSEYIPLLDGYNFNGFACGENKYVYKLKIDSNILNYLENGRAVLKATYSVNCNSTENIFKDSKIELLGSDYEPVIASTTLGVDFEMHSEESLSAEFVNNNKDSILYNIVDQYYIDECDLVATNSFSFNLLKNSQSIDVDSICSYVRIIMPISGIQTNYTSYIIMYDNEVDSFGYRCDKYGNFNLNGKYLAFDVSHTGKFDILGLNQLVEVPFMEEGMVFEYNGGARIELIHNELQYWGGEGYHCEYNGDYSLGIHYYDIILDAGYSWYDGSRNNLSGILYIKTQYPSEYLNRTLSADDFIISLSSISLPYEIASIFNFDAFDMINAREFYNYSSYLNGLSPETHYQLEIKYYLIETDIYFMSEERKFEFEFTTLSIDEFKDRLAENEDKYPTELLDLVDKTQESFPYEGLDDIVTQLDIMSGKENDLKEYNNGYEGRVEDYINNKKKSLINSVSDKTDINDIRNQIMGTEWELENSVKSISQSFNSVEQNITNNEFDDSYSEKINDYCNLLLDGLFDSLDNDEFGDVSYKKDFIVGATQTFADLNDLYKNDVKDNESVLSDKLDDLYQNKVDELLDSEYMFNLSNSELSNFYNYVSQSVEGVSNLAGQVRNCDGKNSKFSANVEASIKTIEVTTFRDYDKDEMDELFYKQADDAVYYHVQELLLAYFDAWFEDLKANGNYSTKKLKELEAQYKAQVELIKNDETFRPIYEEAKQNMIQTGNAASFENLAYALESTDMTTYISVAPVEDAKVGGTDVIIIVLAGMLVIGLISLVFIKRKETLNDK